MSLDDAWDADVTRIEALAEIRKHSACWEDFLAEVGDKEIYEGSEVLGWLGY